METYFDNTSKGKGKNDSHCFCFSGKFSNLGKITENQFRLSKSCVDIIFKSIYHKLNETMRSNLLNIKITILPDFFIDRIIKVSNIDHLTCAMAKKVKVGGGSVRGLSSIDIKGGNAVNVAYCLARLGVKVDLFTVADEVGYSILNAVFKKFSSQVNLHIKNGKHGLTTIFEFTDPSFSVSNVMLSDVGDNCSFGPESIESNINDDNGSRVLSILSSSSAIVVTNWASNLKGTDLLKYVFENSANSVHFLDPADISERRAEFIRDIKNHSELIDLLSINENELLQMVYALSENDDHALPIYLHKKNADPITPLNLCKYAAFLSNFFKIGLCVHTVMGSAWSDGLKTVFVESIPPSKINIVSGAGDSWDSAFLFGHLLNFTDEEKLCFANLVAFLYLENVYGDQPSLLDIADYIYNRYF